LSKRKVWGLTLGFGAYNYAFYIFLTWLPGYLQTQLHMTVLKSGRYTAIPWIVATLADFIIGGWLVDVLIRKGYDQSKVRLTLLVLGMLLGMAVFGAAFTRDPNVAIFWISIALGGLAFSAPIGWSIPALIAPEGSVGTLGASSIVSAASAHCQPRSLRAILCRRPAHSPRPSLQGASC
jgi:cyanate permease